jgi:predicted phage baseplate assembly protein
LDYVEVVDPQQLTLNVFFLGKAPRNIEKANVVLSGGRRIRDVQITSVRVQPQPDPTLDDYLEVHVNKAGDFSDYTISLVKTVDGQPTSEPMDGFDPRYDQVSFSFKASCPTDLDCKLPCTCPPPQRTQPDIDYLAKDYESFRELILDRLALIMPEWIETHAPDLGITLVELLAYAGDYLSYYQDAVATEAYLGTARQRISVRRHARLVDYFMHDGCNARAWLTLWTNTDQTLDPTQIYFITAYPGAPVDKHILAPADFVGVDPSTYEVFEPLVPTPTFTATLVGAQEVPPVISSGTASANLQVDLSSGSLTGSVTFSGLTSNATAAYLLDGAVGTNGEVVLALVGGSGGTSGIWTVPPGKMLTPPQIAHLRAGLLYVNLQSVNFPGGEIRAQLQLAIVIYAAHSEIHFYTWGDCECCLAPGSTSATLTDTWVDPPVPPGQPGTSTTSTGTPSAGTTPVGTTTPAPAASTRMLASPTTQPKVRKAVAAATTTSTSTSTSDGPSGKVRSLQLKVGDILIFEEVLGSKTGQAPDADPSHRQAVRLTKVTPGIDPLYGGPAGTPIVEIEWAAEDALTFPLCISSRQAPPACGCLENVSVARGNVILVDNGGDPVEVLGTVPTDSTTPQCPKCCEPASITISAGLFRPTLSREPLTFSVPLPPACSAADFIRQDPRQALPQISLASIPPAPTCLSTADPTQPQPPCEIPSLFTFDDLADPTGLATSLHPPANPNAQFLLAQLQPSTQQDLAAWDGSLPLPAKLAGDLSSDLNALLQTWSVKRDLLESGPVDLDFTVEVDNDGYGHLRFGDGVCGRQPDAGTLFRANYRVGNGKSGNVGAETLTYIVLRNETLSGVNLLPRNPMAASGGTDPEPIDDVKLFAPYAFRNQLQRAIAAADYASIAADNERRLEGRAALEAEDAAICTAAFTRLQGAKAVLRWTGSWYTTLVALDPVGSETADPELIDEVTLYLEPFRRMGYDVLVSPAKYVPLKVSLTICVLPNFLRGHVEAAVLDALSNRVLPDGTLGFFHPDNLSFGDGIYVSRLLATVQAIPGVQNAMVTELERFELSEPAVDQAGEELPSNSALLLGPFEIAQLDNDPNFPENGVLLLDVRGGR